MKQTRTLMGMPITLELADPAAPVEVFDAVFTYLTAVDERFSTYKPGSEISAINAGRLNIAESSPDMQTIFALAREVELKTDGYFNIRRDGKIDPSGLVKGWAIYNAAELLRQVGYPNFYVEAGGDIQAVGQNSLGQPWSVGIRSPFEIDRIVKDLALSDCGVATSGTYIRGEHIYNPKDGGSPPEEIVSLTVIGPDVCAADCMATAAFAMGRPGIEFLDRLDGFEGYMIDCAQRATFTRGFERYVRDDETH